MFFNASKTQINPSILACILTLKAIIILLKPKNPYFGMFPEFFQSAMAETDREQNRQSTPSSSASGTTFVFSVGGSLLFDENAQAVPEHFERIGQLLSRLSKNGFRIVAVVGGGSPARSAIALAQKANVTRFECDEVGIMVTHQNAQLFSKFLPGSEFVQSHDFRAVDWILEKNQIPVLGGLFPGFTTDAVAALIAEKLDGTLVNLSNVDGVYSSDPKTNSRARLYRELSFEQLFDIILEAKSEPGQHAPLDLFACSILKRSQIPAIFVNGMDSENIESALAGKPFKGTIVQYSEADENAQLETENKDN